MNIQPNRAMRRKAGQQKNKRINRSEVTYTTNFQLEFETFDTIERLFEQIRNGELRYDQRDGWVIMGLSGRDLHILSALEGWLLYWRSLADEQSLQYDDSAMRRLAKSLEYEKPMNLSEVEAAYNVVKIQRDLYRTLPKSVTTLMAKKVQAQLKLNGVDYDY